MPHIKDMVVTIFEPPRRGSEVMLLTILFKASLFTLREAIAGFIIGGGLGFLLGVAFAHSGLLERGLLPYAVASQTVPLLAIAPMVVIWLGGNWLSVAIIAAYLTFFPVTINTLRGLRSPQPTALELMHSYAATPWEILWKLRLPAALPYIFTALKVSATASIVGAIIGELPSGIADGLGRIILNFNQYYATGPEKLWASILFASLTGMVFFVIVILLEKIFLHQQPMDS
jgi:NitT/TauT family transport system permease protein